ncbi:DUF4238 domain-containing protein [Lysinibacillus sp. GbtcB16]|uniref:DUF4238 domain-containing protein n=1 Tax=Lysinibacillus sp. GbtcB16 TaxID=2824761 RepID=UPI001C2F7A5D|nr:DUF4238 domain-containing protein [Lysinibacillus sp. GbtcB16]
MDVSPFYNEDTRIDFSIFLCTQYYRTKKMKNSVIRNTKDIANKMDADIERMWNVISHILATNLSHSLIMKKDSKWTLLTNSKSTFITSDQPIVNIKGKYSNDVETEELELYYPISPSKALLISDINNSPKPDIFEINEEEIKKYNSIILNTCEEQIYLNNIDILKDLM